MLKLIIVDDEAIILKGMQQLIRNMKTPFTDIVGVSDSIEALRIAETFKPDLLITDIQMPEMNGLELIKSIADKKAASKFIILTGYEQFDYALTAIRLQVADYLLKPVDPTELSVLLNKLSLEIIEERNRSQEQLSPSTDPHDKDNNLPICRFKVYIQHHYMKNISLDDVAEYLDLHPNYVSSLVKRETEQTFVQYLRSVRIDKAKVLLHDLPNLPLEQVARTIGFDSPSHFYKVFKQQIGITPGSYRLAKE